MDYEKKYKEALERAKEINRKDIKLDPSITTYEYIFPELKESEDEKNEKVRIGLIKAFNTVGKSEWGGLNVQDILAWLEKQGESYTKRDVDDAFVKGMAFAKDELEKQGEQKSIWHNEDEEPKRGSLILLIMQSGTPIVAKIIEPNHTFNHGERWAYIDDLLEKQSEQILANSAKTCKNEQKPTDKVKPKFKIGEWITNGDYTWKIVEVKPLDYILQSQDGNIVDDTISHVDEQFHSFTIQDAKDGDVLVNWNNTVFIFDKIEDNVVKYIIAYNNKWDDIIKCPKNQFSHLGLTEPEFEFRPATKEQRELLSQKMSEAGYEWSEETHELKKIEPTNNIEPFDKYKGLTDFERTLADICVGWIGEEPGWKQYIKDNADVLLRIAIEKFNSVQDVPFEQKPVEWNEDNNSIISDLLDYFDENKCLKHEVNDIVKWLKTIKPQQKGWSEEDECYMTECINAIATKDGWSFEEKRKTKHWLKSLKDRYTWKPTTEQLRELRCVISGCSFETSILVELEENLKKLL